MRHFLRAGCVLAATCAALCWSGVAAVGPRSADGGTILVILDDASMRSSHSQFLSSLEGMLATCIELSVWSAPLLELGCRFFLDYFLPCSLVLFQLKTRCGYGLPSGPLHSLCQVCFETLTMTLVVCRVPPCCDTISTPPALRWLLDSPWLCYQDLDGGRRVGVAHLGRRVRI